MADLEIVASAVGFDKVNTALKDTENSLKKTGTAAEKAADSMNKIRPGASQATYAMTNLGRVIQDAPYGFIGIANNIDPLLQSFQNLQRETGSVGGAIKALGGSLMGGGGLALAVSAITSLIVVFGSSFSSASTNVDTLSTSTENFLISIDSAKTSLDALLMSIDTASKIKAIDFKIANADKGAQSLFDAANNTATLDQKMVTTGDHAKDLIKLISAVEDEYQKLRVNNEDLPFTIQMASESTDKLSVDATKLTDKWKDLKSEYKKTMVELEKYPEIMKLAKKEQQLANVEDSRQKGKKAKEIETWSKALAKFEKELSVLKTTDIFFNVRPKDDIDNQIKKFKEIIIKGFEKFGKTPQDVDRALKIRFIENAGFKKIPAEFNVDLKPSNLKESTDGAINRFYDNLKEGIAKQKEEISKAINDFKATAVIDAISNFAENIGNIITGKLSFGEAFKAVFASLGENIKQLGQQLIKIGILAKIAQEQLFLNPTAAIAAGIGMVILGAVLKNMMSKNAFATGTTFAPGGMALVGERGPELVNLPRGAKVIPATQTNNMMGAMSSVEVYGVLRGQDIYFSNKKYGQTYNRQA